MKIYAFYLPQFHRIPENDKWWGEGFTEWTNVKKSKPLFKGHVQPKEPLNNNYYNLMSQSTVEWQQQLMSKYKIDGFIYYHYYFDEKMLLQKPAENLRMWKHIDIPFFFCWANHSWYRSWEGIKELLIEQTYGNPNSWEKHFAYLLPFFKDRRYEKWKNKPLLMLFNSNFDEKKQMCKFFDKRCKDEGFDGICIVETCKTLLELDDIQNNISDNTEFVYLREPMVSRSKYVCDTRYTPIHIIRKAKSILAQKGIDRCVKKFNGNKLFDKMIDYKINYDNVMPGVFFEWDNTPRHKGRGSIITPPSKEKFFSYMNSIDKREYLVINAWNEWAEGMMLEPTVQYGYKYLEWVKEWVETNEQR